MTLNVIRSAFSHILTSRAIVDRINLPQTQFSTYKAGMDEISSWVALFKHFDPKKPQTWVDTGLKFANKVSQPKAVVEPPKRSLITRFLEAKGLVKVDQFNALTFYQDIIQKNFKKTVALKSDDGGTLRMLPLGVGFEPLYFYELEKATTHRGKDYNLLAFLPDSVQHQDRRTAINTRLADLFWQDKKHLKVSVGSDHFDYMVVPSTDREYEGALTMLYDTLEKYYASDVRRVLLFNGEPGTGKSTLAVNLAEALSERTIFVTHSTLEWVVEDDWVYFLNMMQPQMLVVDDIDRLGNLLQKKLFLFEETTCNVPLVVLTSNHIEWLPDAFKRPGRIDQIVQMETPGLDIRKDVILKLASLEGVTVPDGRIEVLDAIHQKHSGAYIVELLRRVKVEGWDYKIPSFDRTFSDLSPQLRDEWNQKTVEIPTVQDLTLADFED